MTTPAPYKNKPDANHRFWLYSPEGDGFMFFATAAEREDYAKEDIRAYLDSDSAWCTEVEGVIAGTVTHTIRKTVAATKPADYDEMDEDERDEEWPCGDEFDEVVDYTLEQLP